MRPAIYLHPSKLKTVLRGHPWIFPKAITRHTGALVTGDLVNVMCADGKLVGTGVYNEHSLYRVRVLARALELIDSASIDSIVAYRLRQALCIRQALGLPNSLTNAYRLFNSEADGLSGLTIDRFDHICVVASSAFWVEKYQQVIRACLRDMLPNDEVIWLPQTKPLAQDGWLEVLEPTNEARTGRVLEVGIQYQLDFSAIQKTGLFLDQRDNHQRIAALASGKRVLDLYTYTGGFALHAAKAGAAAVTAVDSSEQAIALANQNAALNGLTDISFVKADARDYLNHAGDYDLIILDPPKLVPSQKHLEKAKNYYRFLHREIFKSMRTGTLLMTCNCSSALSQQDFAELVSSQASVVGKTVRVLGMFGPASCHPVLTSFPEGHYLSAILLAVV